MVVLVLEPEPPALLELASPAAPIPYPRLVGTEHLHPEARDVLEPLWRGGTLASRTVRFHLLRNVFVAAEGLVFDETGNGVFGPSITQHDTRTIEAASEAVRRSRDHVVHTQPTLLCKKRGAHNYGHWLVEMLPRVALATNTPVLSDASICVHRTIEPLRRVMRDGLALLGVPEDRVVETSDAPAFFETLVLVEGLTEHGVYLSPLVVPCLRGLRGATSIPTARNLYVARRTYREFLDRSWLRCVARWNGTDVIDPSVFDFGTQIAMFSDRDTIAGISGAGLANCVFARPGTKLVNFSPGSMCDTFYWLLAALFDLDYTECRCEEIGPPRGPMPWDRDLLIRPRSFRQLVCGR